jgi:hypothetical protein
MRNPALRLLGFGAAIVTFIVIFAIQISGEAKRQALVSRDKAAQVQQERMRSLARAQARASATRAAEDDYRSTDYDSVRYQPESRNDSYSDYRDVASQRSYYEPRTVVVEADDSSDRYESRQRSYEQQRRTDTEADRLTRQLDSRLYER